MKNLNLIRRLTLGSMILGFVVPMTYHITLNMARYNHFGKLTEQVCKAIEPRIQVGAQREALEYLKSTITNQGFDAEPLVEFKDHGNLVTPPILNAGSKLRETCEFQGITGVEVSIFYNHVPVLNIMYLYLYLISVPIFFFVFMWGRRGVMRLQRKVADLIETQMKQLLGMGSVSTPPKTSLFYKLFDLEIPLLKYLKKHIENLEADLRSYSQKIADQQKRVVLMDVAAHMAHEIVTPISNLQMILKSDEATKHQDLILLELGQIRNLSEKLLREYRGEASPTDKNRETIDVVVSILSALESAKLFAKNIRPVDFHFDCNMNEKVELVGDRSDFIAALSNILRNAVEALENDNGVITVKLNKGSENLQLSISDNGCGIKEENLSKIFENKFSVGKRNGTGLGLFQVKSSVENMGGAVLVESKVGVGTTMQLIWPLRLESSVDVPIAGLDQKAGLFQNPDLILIDDTNSNHVRWDIEARRSQKTLASFRSLDDFNSQSKDIKKDTPIFVDYTFEKGPHSGKEIAERIVLAGFSNVHIATGLPLNHVEKPKGIRSVRGKSFPSLELL